MKPVLSGDPGDERTWHGCASLGAQSDDPRAPRRRRSSLRCERCHRSGCRWRSTQDRCTARAPGSATPSPGRSRRSAAAPPRPRTTPATGRPAAVRDLGTRDDSSATNDDSRSRPSLAHRVWARRSGTRDGSVARPPRRGPRHQLRRPTGTCAAPRQRLRLLVSRPSRRCAPRRRPSGCTSCGARSTTAPTWSRRPQQRPTACAELFDAPEVSTIHLGPPPHDPDAAPHGSRAR